MAEATKAQLKTIDKLLTNMRNHIDADYIEAVENEIIEGLKHIQELLRNAIKTEQQDSARLAAIEARIKRLEKAYNESARQQGRTPLFSL